MIAIAFSYKLTRRVVNMSAGVPKGLFESTAAAGTGCCS